MSRLIECSLAFTIGSILGSFFNLVAYRIPLKQSIIHPASHCPHCKRKLKYRELVPIISQLFLNNHCFTCHHPIPMTSLVAEGLSGLFFLFYQQSVMSLFTLLLCYMALTLALTDLFYQLVEPKILSSFSFCLLMSHYFDPNLSKIYFLDTIILFLSLTLLNQLIPNGIGGGDIKLLTVWSFFLGYYSLLFIILWACFSCLCFLLIRKGASPQSSLIKIPFVPFLTFGLYLTIVQMLFTR